MSGYDEKCGELAGYFLPYASETKIEELAQHIQYAIEDFLADMESPIEPLTTTSSKDGE